MAQLQQQQDPDIHYMPYYPMTDPQRPGLTDSSLLYYIKENRLLPSAQGAADNFRERVIQWIRDYIDNNFRGMQVVITTVPRRAAGQWHQFLVDFCERAINGLDNAEHHHLLERIQGGLPAHQGGPRDQQIHQETIRVNTPQQGIQGKVILVLDDIWTTGSTMRACKENLLQALGNGTDIRLLVVGRTA